MKYSIRSLAPVLAVLSLTTALSACGGQRPMNGAYNPQQQMGYNQMGQTSYAQAGMQNGMVNGQSAYMQQQNAYAQTPNLSPPMPQSFGQTLTQPAETQAPAQTTAARSNTTVSKTTTAASTTKKSPLPTTSKTSTPAKTAQPAQPAAAKSPAVSDYLNKARQAMASVKTLSATVATLEKSPKGNGSGKIQYTFSNNQVKIDVTASSDSSRQGVKIGYQVGGNQVRVRPNGILKMVALNLAMNDSKVVSGRNYLIGQIDLAATVNRLTQPGIQAKVLGKTTFAGAEVIVIEITSPCSFDAQITKEHLGVDAKTFMPRIHEMYQGTDLVYAGRIEQLTVNPPLPANALEI